MSRSRIVTGRSTEPQRHPAARHKAFWALVTGVLLAVLIAVVQIPSPTRTARSDRLFYSNESAALAYVVDSANAVNQEAGSPRSDKWPTLFDKDIELVTQGDVLNKWSHARAEIARELRIVDRCRKDNVCPDGAQRLIDLSSEGAGRDGRARLGLINRAVNLAISPTSDEAQWRVTDHWSSALETLRSERGDCEDYAIVKYLALLDAGISEADLKIVVMKSIFPHEDHAVVAARVDDEWLILDNRTLTLVRDMNLTRAVPVFVLDQVGAWRFVPGNRSHRTRGWAS
jgi:predicted transglutaminase-like cysteine proteinase